MSGWGDYLYPGTKVLRNKQNITDPDKASEFEARASKIAMLEMRHKPVQGDFDLDHMQAIHRQLFKDVYTWAGELRTVDMAKGKGTDRTVFAYTEDIAKYGKTAHDIVRDANYGRGQSRAEIGQMLGDVYSVVNGMHPFREGNGRTTREYMRELAKVSGHDLDFMRVDKERWNEAAKLSAHGNPAPIREVFYQIAVVERALAFDRMKPLHALEQHPELDGALKLMVEGNNKDLGALQVRKELSQTLHEGFIVGRGAVTREESALAIDHSAKFRGLLVRDAGDVGGQQGGQIIGVSSHHAMLQVGDMMAIRYERENLDREVYQGERVAILHSPERSHVYDQALELDRSRGGRDMEREREFHPHS